MTKILVTGVNGYIGSNLVNYLSGNYDILGTSVEKQSGRKYRQLDITDERKVNKIVSSFKPDVIIHTAGLSSLTLCETDKETAYKINVLGTENIIKAIKKSRRDIKLVFLSSDYVFDGKSGNYGENSKAKPATYYGYTKLESEKKIKKELSNYIICRSANVYGNKGGNFFKFVFDSITNNKPIDVYGNVFYTPTHIDFLIDSLMNLVKTNFSGVIHITGKEKCSRYEFALSMAKALGIKHSLVKKTKQPKDGFISEDSSLNSNKLYKLLPTIKCPTIEKNLMYEFGVLIRPYFAFSDSRGSIVGIDQFHVWKEINYIESRENCTRGNHYHKFTTEGFYIIRGKIHISTIDIKNNKVHEFDVSPGDSFIVAPNTLHIFTTQEKSAWINFLSIPMKGKKKDFYTLQK
jgi:dTDP-4-dehydrorhamnose reductase